MSIERKPSFAPLTAWPRLPLRTPAPCTQSTIGRLFFAAPLGRPKYPETGTPSTQSTWTSKHSILSSSTFTGFIEARIGTFARRSFCAVQNVSKSSGRRQTRLNFERGDRRAGEPGDRSAFRGAVDDLALENAGRIQFPTNDGRSLIEGNAAREDPIQAVLGEDVVDQSLGERFPVLGHFDQEPDFFVDGVDGGRPVGLDGDLVLRRGGGGYEAREGQE